MVGVPQVRAVEDNATESRDNDPDADVVALVAAGDVAGGLQRLMRRHGAAVYRYCREALRDTALADDTHQQVFIEAFRDLPRFRQRSKLRTWLFAIARNRVLDASKKARRAHAHLEDVEAADALDPRPSPASSIDAAALREILADGLAKLDDDVRTSLLLRYQQDFSFREMAEICGEKAGTLRARVTRALPLLRRYIEARVGRSA